MTGANGNFVSVSVPRPLLELRDLRLALADRAGKPLFGAAPRKANEILKGINLQLNAGESVGIVGESGSGKTTLGRSILRLYEPTGGAIYFQNRDITHLSERKLRKLRADLQIIFQDPQSSLNPRQRIGTILAQPLWAYRRIKTRQQANQAACELLERVNLPAEFIKRFPHELSGGQRQRVGIARAIALKPKLVVADEIVSGLDVSSQAQILALLRTLKRDLDLALIFISHDLSVVRILCDRVLVMHHGEVLEAGACAELFASPQTAYTRTLLDAVPLPVVEPDWLETEQQATPPLRQQEDSAMQIPYRVALVTGANRGIGREFVNALLARGIEKVYACARDKNKIADLVEAYPGRVEAIRLDITNFEHIALAAGHCHDIDLLINNAGVNRLQGLIAGDDLGAAREEMNTNYFGTLAMCRTFAPVLKNNGGGYIINMLSILAHINLPMMGSLCASKAAGLSMTQGVRAELAGQGTRVIAVMPGAVDTDMSRDFPPPKMPPAEVAQSALDAIINGEEDIYPGAMAMEIIQALGADNKAMEKEFARLLPTGTQLITQQPEPERVLQGGCFCGAIRYEIKSRSFHELDCACSICRGTSGADSVKWITVPKNSFRLLQGEMGKFSSSQKGRRSFCPQCGTALACEVDVFPDDIDVAASTFDDPGSIFKGDT